MIYKKNYLDILLAMYDEKYLRMIFTSIESQSLMVTDRR